MDRILFGDNQFFGINHMSEEKARQQAMRFADVRSIIAVLDIAYELGIKTFMCTTHERIGEICDHVRAHPNKYEDFEIYPCMPYAHKYNNAISQHGMLGALKMYAPRGLASTLLKGAQIALSKDVYELMKLLVDAEMKRFQGVSTGVIFLQNVVTDLILGLGLGSFYTAFSEYVQERYRATPGFITMNLPRLLDALDACGIVNPIVCSSINRIGFRMCGGIELYEQTIAQRKFRPIAMSVFASGALRPEEALAYVCGQKKIESILFGGSTKQHIQQTVELIQHLDNLGDEEGCCHTMEVVADAPRV
jgi:hypothetical protein